ncbi:hypothetical protein BS78_09G175900 [Paspalum vaginatum]|nr:hypothetical protein BS78_09G175900 [Paspalum vaginatum]
MLPEDSPAHPPVGVLTSPPSTPEPPPSAARTAATTFVEAITTPVAQPLLQPQNHQQMPPRKSGRNGIKLRARAPSRRSARLAAISWPRGDIQSRARQVLMKRLGVLPEADATPEKNQVTDAILQCYFNLFSGPLTDLVIKALAALCGLDGLSEASPEVA